MKPCRGGYDCAAGHPPSEAAVAVMSACGHHRFCDPHEREGPFVVLVRSDGGWVPAMLTSFESESALQALLYQDPSLIPGCAGAAVVRELGIPGVGSADLVCVDGEGIVTIVECKLKANPQIRREIVGQIYLKPQGPVIAINLGSIANTSPTLADAMATRLRMARVFADRLREHDTEWRFMCRIEKAVRLNDLYAYVQRTAR
jgi:hypothetical protein